MTRNHSLKQLGLLTLLLGISGLAAGRPAEQIGWFKPTSPGSKERILHFPLDQRMGILSVMPEPGARLDPRRVCLSLVETHLGMARGDVNVPADRDICMSTGLSLSRSEEARLRAREPLVYRTMVVDAVQTNPFDLSGLAGLDPNDLYMLKVNRLIRKPDADQRVLEPISRLTGLRVLGLNATGVTETGMERLGVLQSLQALELSREFFIKNQGVAILKDLPALEFLDLDTGTTDVGLRHIGQIPNLRWLRIRTGRIWGPGLAELANLPHLERLCLWGTAPISDRHIAYLEGLTQLRSLTLWGCVDNLTDASLASIAKLENLEELYFIRANPRFTDSGIAPLKKLKNLRVIDFGQTGVGDDGVKHLTALPHLEEIEGGLLVTAEGIKTLSSLPSLKSLHVGIKRPRQGESSETGISYLAGMDSLEELSVINVEISDEDLRYLESLTNLRHLTVSGSGITDLGLVSIAKLKKLEYLDLSFVNVTKRGLSQLKPLTSLDYLRVILAPEKRYAIDESTLDLSSLRSLKELRLTGLALDELDMASLGPLAQLEKLTIETHSLSSGSLKSLSNLSELRRLSIDGLACTDDGSLAPLNTLSNLADLTLRGHISEAALTSLHGLPHLWSLTVHSTEPTRRRRQVDLAEQLTGIEYIHVYRTPSAPPESTFPPQRTSPNRRPRR